MRTTVVLDDEVYDVIRRRAFEQRRPIGAVLSDLARGGLRAEATARGPRPWGKYAGQILMAEDFDETPPDLLAALEQPLDRSS